ncbi:GlcNAc-PI de-N-acetylase [Tumebacillus algifaecis]|uniref:GlcNAc-PI de-N-acetylase n=1 Tax=Tumebacillus algifaecis TaxID=1214604 RepID=A0A223CX55_9BACL|nr:PIG-L deacetylase family protein [Tumebacillus algifaecis]ASS73949.1 GlcNAc-PI de-N-acetylase [Tumebacillus algifaecis]
MKKILVIAPHPDDETLGCGGALLKHRANGDELHWLIVTGISTGAGFSEERVASRNGEILQVGNMYGFESLHKFNFPTAQLDTMPIGDIVQRMGRVMHVVQPEVVYLPYRGDVHTDHKIVFDAAVSCTKWFRYPSIKRVLAYETLSETEFGINPDSNGFRPNVFVDISEHLEQKLEIMRIFASEMGEFPFPRSEQAIRALAALRGAAAGCAAAESFMLLKERD